jgi:two-component system chemotaxis response regulator CheY
MAQSVLVVDDSAVIRQMVAYTLKQAGFTVLEAGDGQEGLERVESGPVDLVITDLNMPRMDGITFIRELRSRPASRRIPVLMLTTESQDSKRQEGRAAGATGWIVKPFHPEKLLTVIGRVLP